MVFIPETTNQDTSATFYSSRSSKCIGSKNAALIEKIAIRAFIFLAVLFVGAMILQNTVGIKEAFQWLHAKHFTPLQGFLYFSVPVLVVAGAYVSGKLIHSFCIKKRYERYCNSHLSPEKQIRQLEKLWDLSGKIY